MVDTQFARFSPVGIGLKLCDEAIIIIIIKRRTIVFMVLTV